MLLGCKWIDSEKLLRIVGNHWFEKFFVYLKYIDIM